MFIPKNSLSTDGSIKIDIKIGMEPKPIISSNVAITRAAYNNNKEYQNLV